MTLKRSTDILEHNMIWSPFDKKLIKQFKKNQKNFKNMLRVRFIGTSSGDYEFKPYDLIGEVILKNVHTPYITYDCNIFAILVCGKIGS